MGIKKSIITDFSSGTPSSTYSVSTGYSVGSEWVNTNNGNRFYHKTDGNWVLLNIDSPFYIQGGTLSAFDTTSNIYRTGSLNIGSGTATGGRFVVSSSTGSVSLVVTETGTTKLIYNSSYSFNTTTNALVLQNPNGSAASMGVTTDGNLRLFAQSFAVVNGSDELWFGRFNQASIQAYTGPLVFYTSLEAMRIMPTTGNVGIGTATPSTKLHIFATQSGAFRLQDGTQSYPGYVLTSDANGVGTWQGNTQITLSGPTATALATWNNTTVMSNFSATCLITIPDTGLPPNFSFRFIIISGNNSAAVTFTYSSPVSILPNTLLTFAQYESGVIDRYGTSSNYYITY